MKTRHLAALTACLLTPLCVGCVTGQPMFRAQTPGITNALHTDAPGKKGKAGVASVKLVNHEVANAHHHIAAGSCQGCRSGQVGPGGCQNPNCPNCRHHGHWHGGSHYGQGHFGGLRRLIHGNQGPVGDWYPTHYHTSLYHGARNLRYPTTGVPAGLVQYPYYTLRGPTDFFLKTSPW